MSGFAKTYRDSVFVEVRDVPWLPFKWSEGGLKWKLLYTAPGDERWTVMFRGPKGSYIYPHMHFSQAEGMLLYGQVGSSAPAVDGAEPEDKLVWLREGGDGDRHQKTTMMQDDTCFFLTITGPIRWISEDEHGNEIYNDVDAGEVQKLWDEEYAGYLAREHQDLAIAN